MTATKTTTTDRALCILYYCASQSGGSSFSDLKRVGGGLASMTLSRILTQLLSSQDLRKDAESGLYFCGSRFLQAARAACGQTRLEDLLSSVVIQLAEKTGHSSAYFHWDGDWIYTRLKHELPENFHYVELGKRNHPIQHTFFRTIQSALPQKTLKRLGVANDVAELAAIRKNGFFIQTEPYRFPVLRVTAPVFYGPQRKIAGAIGITSLIQDMDDKAMQQLTDSVCASADQSNLLLQSMEHV